MLVRYAFCAAEEQEALCKQRWRDGECESL